MRIGSPRDPGAGLAERLVLAARPPQRRPRARQRVQRVVGTGRSRRLQPPARRTPGPSHCASSPTRAAAPGAVFFDGAGDPAGHRARSSPRGAPRPPPRRTPAVSTASISAIFGVMNQVCFDSARPHAARLTARTPRHSRRRRARPGPASGRRSRRPARQPSPRCAVGRPWRRPSGSPIGMSMPTRSPASGPAAPAAVTCRQQPRDQRRHAPRHPHRSATAAIDLPGQRVHATPATVTSATRTAASRAWQDRGVRVHLGSDHAGHELRLALIDHLTGLGHEPVDHGPQVYDARGRLPAATAWRRPTPPSPTRAASASSSAAAATARRSRPTRCAGARCALAFSDETATLGREHNNANVLSLGARMYPRGHRAPLRRSCSWTRRSPKVSGTSGGSASSPNTSGPTSCRPLRAWVAPPVGAVLQPTSMLRPCLITRSRSAAASSAGVGRDTSRARIARSPGSACDRFQRASAAHIRQDRPGADHPCVPTLRPATGQQCPKVTRSTASP